MTLRESILALHRHVERRHFNGRAIVGPDCGLRFHYRVTRFVRSYLRAPALRRHFFCQAQGYWIRANWRLHERTGDPRFRAIALATTEGLLAAQRPDGAFDYPLPQRRGLIATIEGCFATIGFVESFRRTRDARFLDAAWRWHHFFVRRIGFQPYAGGLCPNYFDRPRGNVPNNAIDALWAATELADVSRTRASLTWAPAVIRFLGAVQLPSGELPYVVESPYEARREHYLCFQYNAFEYVKLARLHDLTGDAALAPILTRLARFLARGVARDGHALADCAQSRPKVPYWTGALAQALLVAESRGDLPPDGHWHVPYETLARLQRRDGGFDFSREEPGGLIDRGSYPRNQAMLLESLLERERLETLTSRSRSRPAA